MRIEDLDVTLMMDPCLNKVISLANFYAEFDRRIMRCRVQLASTCLYHNALSEMFERARKSFWNKHKKILEYPTIRYLGNIEIIWLPTQTIWKVTITNGKKGKERKEKETIFIRKIMNKPHLFIEEEKPT